MNKKYYRVVAEPVEEGRIYSTETVNYGTSFGKFRHFLTVYGNAMDQVNIPVDFLVLVNNNIAMMGESYLEILNNAVNIKGNIELSKVSSKPEYRGYEVPLDVLQEFLQSFNEVNPFEVFTNGPELWEFFLEKVRSKKFRGFPSRLYSTFFFTDKSDAETFAKKVMGEIYEVEIVKTRNLQEFDMQIIDDLPTTISRDELYKKLTSYWNHDETEEPVIEAVLRASIS